LHSSTRAHVSECPCPLCQKEDFTTKGAHKQNLPTFLITREVKEKVSEMAAEEHTRCAHEFVIQLEDPGWEGHLEANQE